MDLQDNPANATALEIVRRQLDQDGRGALAHLLNNALGPVVAEASMLERGDGDVDELTGGLARVAGVVKKITTDREEIDR